MRRWRKPTHRWRPPPLSRRPGLGHPLRMRKLAVGIAVALAVVGGAASSSASAAAYWGNTATGTIGRAGLDGSNVDQSFVSGASEHAARNSGRVARVLGELRRRDWARESRRLGRRAELHPDVHPLGLAVDSPMCTGAVSVRPRSGEPIWTAPAWTRPWSPASPSRSALRSTPATSTGPMRPGGQMGERPGRIEPQEGVHIGTEQSDRASGRRRPSLLREPGERCDLSLRAGWDRRRAVSRHHQGTAGRRRRRRLHLLGQPR